MASILIYTEGTLGDHLPYVALGEALSARGHRVRFAINQAMHGYVQRLGLEAVALTDTERGPEEARRNAWAWDHWHQVDLSSIAEREPFDPNTYVTQARELIDLCQDADLLIATSIRTLGCVAHAVTAIPWLTVSMNPYTFWQPSTLEEREAWLEGRLREYENLKELLAYAFEKLRPDLSVPGFSKAWLYASHVILASSPHFSQPDLDQLQPFSSLDITGFWYYQDPSWRGWEPSEELRRFCDRRPLVLTFSSQPLADPRSALALHVEAAARLGLPLLIQRGWAGFSEEDLPPGSDPSQLMFADFLPHDWLFSQAACAIQHGGIGSIARALRSGCPLVVEPYGNDQLYNAGQVARLGAGVAMHPFEMTVDGLVQVLSEEVLSPAYRQRAEALGTKLRLEDGLGSACRAVETYLERVKLGEENASPRATPLLANRYAPPTDVPPAGIAVAATARRSSQQPSSGPIPMILHQTWIDASIPPQWARFRDGWQKHHPDWTHYLWTDADNREFLRRHYAWFLPIYDNYSAAINRADAVRYFILYHFGGVYADLDSECLRPLDPLLAGKQIVFGQEPPAHLEMHRARGYRLGRIVTNAFMASVPGHPFWEHVFRLLVGYHLAPNPLDATGPFLLTRACESFPDRETISLEAPDVLSPRSSEMPWDHMPPEVRQEVTRDSFVIHHWAGTWWRPGAARQTAQVALSLLINGAAAAVSAMRVDAALALLRQAVAKPRVSCLMVTRNRPALAERAVRCFQGQSYADRELVIVDDGEDRTLERWVQELEDPRIVYVRVPDEGRTLGDLRNLAVDSSSGTFVTQWDDDDLSDPRRLEIQTAAINLTQADACLLQRELLWWPESRRLAVSAPRLWEGSFVCAKAKLPAYPSMTRGEDTPIIEQIVRQGRVALLDHPQLYIYTYHGNNTFTTEHWERHWQAAGERFEDHVYDIMVRNLEEQLNLDLSPWTVQAHAMDSPGMDGAQRRGPESVGVSSPRTQPRQQKTPPAQTPERKPRRADGRLDALPTILILTPVKDAESFLPRFWENLSTFTYPHDRIGLAFLESDSADGTAAAIERRLPELRAEFARAELFEHDYGYQTPVPRWEASQQFRRRSVLARSRNYLLSRALRDEEWVLWIDVDLASWPPDVIEHLLATREDIVVPNCLQQPSGKTFDYNTFKLKPGAEQLDWSLYLLDGILLPPHGYGRLYLSDLRQYEGVEIDAVGATMLLIRADLHREGLIFPTYSHKYHIETEGLAVMARDMGYRCWGLPNLEIFHP